MAKTGIIGAGSWGCALAYVLDKNGHEVTVWSIVEDEVSMLKECREHKDKLPGVKLSEKISFTGNMKEASEGMDLIVLAVPSAYTRSTAEMLKPHIRQNQIIVSVEIGRAHV